LTDNVQDRGGWLPYHPPDAAGRYPWAASRVWLWSVVAFATLAFVSCIWAIPYFEDRLDRVAKTRLEAAGLDTTSLDLRWNYRDLTVAGVMPPGINAEELATVLRQGDSSSRLFATGIRKLQLDLRQPDVPVRVVENDQSLAVSVDYNDNEANLNGVVQSQAQREQLVNALLDSGIERINDNLDVDRRNAARSGGDAKVEALASLLALSGPDRVALARANLSETDLSYQITALNKESSEALENAASIAVMDFRVTGEVDYVKYGEIDVTGRSDGQTLTLTGQVSTPEQRNRLAFAAAESAGVDNVRNNIAVSGLTARDAAADEHVESLALLLTRFSSGNSGEVQLQGSRLDITPRNSPVSAR